MAELDQKASSLAPSQLATHAAGLLRGRDVPEIHHALGPKVIGLTTDRLARVVTVHIGEEAPFS